MYAEIHMGEPFGITIYNVVKSKQLRRNLEIGSWSGAGSTNCFFKAMSELGGDLHFDCVEIVEDKFKELSDRYKDNSFVHCHNKSSISYDELVYKNFYEIWESPFNKIPKHIHGKELVKSWFDRDVATIKSASSMNLSLATPYDGVLIDGSEFTGYSEFLLIKDKARVIFLDDVHNAFKCFQIHDELLNDASWTCLVDAPYVRNGFSIFEKI